VFEDERDVSLLKSFVAANRSMPSHRHEALLQLFRNRPTLAVELLRDVLHAELPEYSDVRIDSRSGYREIGAHCDARANGRRWARR
jgi:hypothetical protein